MRFFAVKNLACGKGLDQHNVDLALKVRVCSVAYMPLRMLEAEPQI